jgi:hypothetical protein
VLTKRSCCCGTPPECSPCTIPHRDIVISWSRPSDIGSGTLTYLGGTSWQTFTRFNFFSDGFQEAFGIACNDGLITFSLSMSTLETGLLTQCNMTLNDEDDFTCDPFHLHFVLATHPNSECRVPPPPFFGDPHLGYTDIWFD